MANLYSFLFLASRKGTVGIIAESCVTLVKYLSEDNFLEEWVIGLEK